MRLQISVTVHDANKDAMRNLIEEIKNKNLQLVSFEGKRSLLNELFSVTNDMINEQREAFNQAIDQIYENRSISVLHDLEATHLIEKAVGLQIRIMESYL